MLALALLLLTCIGDGEASSPAALMAAGDEAFQQMAYPAAIACYESSLTRRPEDPQILWRLARVYVCYGESYEDARRKELCLKAEEYARRCLRADSARSEGHTWLAGALGYIALDEGMKRQAQLSFEILAEADRALALQPRDDAALSIKGSLYRALGNTGWFKRRMASLLLGGVPDGGYEEAEAALKQAIAIAPDIMRHQYELGILYLDWGRTEEARQTLSRASTLPVRTAIDVPRLKKIKKFLEELGK
ncbi:MAG TPA: tetratricopeptide repeat protein [Bacteroidota bacterium]